MNHDTLETERPDSPIEKFTVALEKGPGTATWRVTCREWRCELYTRNPTKAVALLVSEIEDHNQECYRAGKT